MRHPLYACILLVGCMSPVTGQVGVDVGVATPGAQLGFRVPAYPAFAPVPGYPVYYASDLDLNLFFYDGMYWVYDNDNWYASTWYDGPWVLTEPLYVPTYILRIPVAYYRVPPAYFRGWRAEAPPHWGERWGPAWARSRAGWEHRRASEAPPAAPLPHYQQPYSGARYPRQIEQQRRLQQEHYPYRPSEPAVHERYRNSLERQAPGPAGGERRR